MSTVWIAWLWRSTREVLPVPITSGQEQNGGLLFEKLRSLFMRISIGKETVWLENVP